VDSCRVVEADLGDRDDYRLFARHGLGKALGKPARQDVAESLQ